MKSILKNHQGQRSKGTVRKVPLRVTFLFDENHTQKQPLHFTHPFSWMRQNPSAGSDSKETVKGNEEEVKSVKKEIFWREESEFKRENIHWNSFVLVYNPKFTRSTFFCGKCQKSYSKIAEFAFHSLTECGEIFNSNSSHFIFDQKEWQSFVKQQLTKSGKQKKQKICDTPQLTAFQKRMKEIRAFTETTLSSWRQTGQKQNFIIDQHYFFQHNLVYLMNPLSEGYSKQHMRKPKYQCPRFKSRPTYKRGYSFIKSHFYDGQCCQTNTIDSTFLLLDGELFHNYLIETGRFKLDDKRINLPCLVYWHNRDKKKVEERYPKFKYFKAYIEIFYEMRLPIDNIPADNSIPQQYRKAQILLFYKTVKAFSWVLFWENFKDETFYCPCQNFLTAMTISELAVHLMKNPHHTIKIADFFSM